MIRLVAIALVAACARSPRAAAPAPVCAPSQHAPVDAVRAMYAALAADDTTAWQAATSPEFFAYDIGERFDRAGLARVIAEAHAKGRRFVWNVTEPVVDIDCTLAVVTYVNAGSVDEQPVKWLESAWLRHDGNRWRVHFLHSTRARPPKP